MSTHIKKRIYTNKSNGVISKLVGTFSDCFDRRIDWQIGTEINTVAINFDGSIGSIQNYFAYLL